MRAFRIAYDGTAYHGFQRQPTVPTVEDAIFDGLQCLDVFPDGADKPRGYAAAGRTDAGVSALGQTIAFDARDWLTPRAMNAELPASIRAWAMADAPEDFHATHHATERTYTYHLFAPKEADSNGDIPRDDVGDGDSVNDERFAAVLDALSGEHDFHNLTPDDRGTTRTIALDATRDGPFLVVSATSGGFARELVRRLVSLAHAVGTGTEPLEKVDRVFSPEPLPGHEGIAPAPPEPLILTRVTYPDLAFEVDERAAASARSIFEARRRRHAVCERVSRQLRNGLGQ